MAFRTAFVAMAPDGDPTKNRVSMSLPKYEFIATLVGLGDYDQAAAVCKNLVDRDGIQAIVLCPGFTHEGVAKVVNAVGPSIAVNVARGDPTSGAITGQLIAQEWFGGELPH
jgi:hypothetical protein